MAGKTKHSERFDFGTHSGKERFWHSSAHLLAQAVLALFPKAKITIGPAVESGFYYDIDNNKPFTSQDLNAIGKKMYELAKKNLKIERKELSLSEAKKLFKDNPYKLDMVKELAEQGEKLTAYKQGDFIDLCRGPHIDNTGMIKAIKLTKVAGAYWKGDAKKKQLQRIYGISFPDKKQMEEYTKMLAEAEKRDHIVIGEKLGLFSFHDEGKGFPFWHAKGMFIFNTLADFMRKKLEKLGYQEIRTPIILSKELWLRSGHWDHYKENMYFTNVDAEEYAVRPMNCPGSVLVYKSQYRSYRELPLKLAEFGINHRHELSGVIHGLTRVRAFTMDDAHIYCTEEQIPQQVEEMIKLAQDVYGTFGFKYDVELSTKPEKAMGSDELWEKAESGLKKAADRTGIKYKINPGDGAFYGPKIDFKIKDALNREWQLCTIQLDFQMPERFDIRYMGKDGTNNHRPVMIHRAILGSMERFTALLIEHFAGKLPLWISPVQARVLTISEKFNKYAEDAAKKMREAGLRVELDNRTESIGYKVRDAQLQKINYILVVGDNEKKAGAVNVRTRDNKVLGMKKTDTFIEAMKKEIEGKEIK